MATVTAIEPGRTASHAHNKKRAGAEPTPFVSQDKCAALKLRMMFRPTAAQHVQQGHYIFLAFFFAFLAMVASDDFRLRETF
jgi:hypothetical protein